MARTRRLRKYKKRRTRGGGNQDKRGLGENNIVRRNINRTAKKMKETDKSVETAAIIVDATPHETAEVTDLIEKIDKEAGEEEKESEYTPLILEMIIKIKKMHRFLLFLFKLLTDVYMVYIEIHIHLFINDARGKKVDDMITASKVYEAELEKHIKECIHSLNETTSSKDKNEKILRDLTVKEARIKAIFPKTRRIMVNLHVFLKSKQAQELYTVPNTLVTLRTHSEHVLNDKLYVIHMLLYLTNICIAKIDELYPEGRYLDDFAGNLRKALPNAN